MGPISVREARTRQDRSAELAEKGWYHSFELPDGTRIEGVNPLEYLQRRWARFPIPADLHDRRVLDIGAWDGWFSFEAERRGAAVTAIDYIEQPHFLELHKKLASKIDYRNLEVYELPDAGLGKFDIVFLLGVLYHLKHPLLALEIVCAMATDVAIVESFVTDGATWQEHANDIPTMEFYEGYELANQFDNWVGPSVSCLLAMCRAAGFVRVELLSAEPYNAVVACRRKWEAPPERPAAEAPHIRTVGNSANHGINFRTRKEQYVSCWFRTSRQEVAKADLRLEVDGFGAAAYYAGRLEGEWWLANFRLPPGLTPGWKEVRLRFADSGFSEAARIAVDIPLRVGQIECLGVQDGVRWTADEVQVTDAGYLVSYIQGLPENCDRDNVRVFLGETRLVNYWIGPLKTRQQYQVNSTVPAGFPKGAHDLHVECGGVKTAARKVRIV